MPRRLKKLRTGAQKEVGVSLDGAQPNHVNDGLCPAFLKFLECHVLMDQLMQFLTFEEMKVLSLVSKEMLAAVRRTIQFSTRSRFNIKKKPDAPMLELHNRFPLSWKHISFDVSLPMWVVNQFADKLNFVESLVLYYKYTDPEDRPSESEKLTVTSIGRCCSRIHKILSISTNLRELQLDVLFMKYPLSEMFSSEKVQQSMRNLESLIVNGRGSLRLNSLDLTQFQRNMLQLSRCPLTNLRRFSIKKMSHRECDSVAEIIKGFKETLQVLELNQSIWRMEEMKAIRCPKLKKLFAGIYEDELKDVAEFVEKQPLLEELLLELYSPVPNEDLKCFQGRLQNLRKLCYYLEWDYEADMEVIEVDWSFLESMTKLEEFTVRLPYGGRGAEMIDRIPASVKKLHLECHWEEQDFWSRRHHLEERNTISTDIGNHLKRLKNLTHLTFEDCSDAINDVGLQTVIKNLPNLMGLRLKNCAGMTDFGIFGVGRNVGVSGNEPGVPLSDIKGLVELEISFCGWVTTACILRVVRFECLRSFIFKTSKEDQNQDMDQFVSRLKEQNPRLTFIQHNRHTWAKNGLVWTHELKLNDDSSTTEFF